MIYHSDAINPATTLKKKNINSIKFVKQTQFTKELSFKTLNSKCYAIRSTEAALAKGHQLSTMHEIIRTNPTPTHIA